MTTTLLAVNGTLMRGLELNPNMQKAGGIFVREDRTDAHYRLWSINDRHPGMIRVNEGGTHVDVEIWQLPLAIGKIKLADGSEVLGVLAENWLTEGQREITELCSWRKYTGHFHTV